MVTETYTTVTEKLHKNVWTEFNPPESDSREVSNNTFKYVNCWFDEFKYIQTRVILFMSVPWIKIKTSEKWN